MKLHMEEMQLARAYNGGRDFEDLTAEQMHVIMDRGRELFKWFKTHTAIHNLINAVTIVSIFIADGFVLLVLPSVFLDPGGNPALGRLLLASLIVGLAHAWLMYSMVVFSLHEGAAHNLIFAGRGRMARACQLVANNLCRLNQGEPIYYAPCHMAHHAKFGTEQDSEFLNFVVPRRLWISLLPWSFALNWGDFFIHRPPTFTPGRVVSAVLTALYLGTYAVLMYASYGLAFTLLTMVVVFPHVGFYLDRLRQFTEHNLMPLDNRSGARSFGIGFWGLLIGGGPWGQPCHLAHHLVPSVPWYHQIVLHYYLRKLLTERQREQFMLRPVIGFPRLLWQVVRDANSFAGASGVGNAGRRASAASPDGRA